MIPIVVYIGIFFELIIVSWVDITTRKISNKWVIANLLIFIALLFIYPDYYILAWNTFLYSAVFLITGFILYLLNIMGGGDSKYLFSFFLLVPLRLQEHALYYLLITTLITGIIFFLMNVITHFSKLIEYFKNQDIQGVKSCFGSKFAFAPVILLSWISVGWMLKEAF